MPVADVNHCDHPDLVIDPVYDPVSPAPGTEPVVKGRKKALPDTVWLR
jgi:hypothetical protein